MPSNFYADVICRDPRFLRPGRCADLELLEPATRGKVQAILTIAEARGHDLMVWETFRSSIRQEALFVRGATTRHFVGVHKFGLACDIVFRDPDGDPSWRGDFTILRDLAREVGLVWGGDWGEPGRRHSIVDSDHVQLVTKADQARLFDGSWYPPADYSPFPR